MQSSIRTTSSFRNRTWSLSAMPAKKLLHFAKLYGIWHMLYGSFMHELRNESRLLSSAAFSPV